MRATVQVLNAMTRALVMLLLMLGVADAPAIRTGRTPPVSAPSYRSPTCR